MNQFVERLPIVVVTGGTSGIGRATVQALAERGARVIAIGRDAARCRDAESEIRIMYPEAEITYLVADLATTGEVRRVAGAIRDRLGERGETLDAVVNNAGVASTWRLVTAEGYEQQFAVNHLAAFVLTSELMPLLAAGRPGRVIVVSSGSHRRTRFNWTDPMLTRGYSLLRAYKQSKLANVLFCAELNRREAGTSDVRAWAVDPGLVRTEIGSKASGRIERFIWKLRTRSRRAVDPDVPARALASLAAGDEVHEPQAFYRLRERPDSPDPAALDRTAAARLWALSERLAAIDSHVETT